MVIFIKTKQTLHVKLTLYLYSLRTSGKSIWQLRRNCLAPEWSLSIWLKPFINKAFNLNQISLTLDTLKKMFSNFAKVVVLALLIFTIKPLEATRVLVHMNSTFGANTNKVSSSQKRSTVPPSTPDGCTYIPSPGEHCPMLLVHK